MSHFKAKMHQIRFLESVRPSVRASIRWSLTQKTHKIGCEAYEGAIALSLVESLPE